MLSSLSHNRSACGFLVFASARLSLAVIFAVLCSNTGFGADTSIFEARFELSASHLEINEGDIVVFDIVNKQYVNSSTGTVFDLEADLSAVEWDFGVGERVKDEAFGLYNIKHRFRQDSDNVKLVKATHQNTTKEVSIRVNNVAPTIHSVSVTKPARKGVPLVFQAGAKDPGVSDRLVFKWDFGDGATATGMAVTHTYASDGIYQVSVKVNDEKESSGGTFPVRVSQREFTPGELDVDGDIMVDEALIDGVILVGSTANPTNPSAGGVCQLRLEMRSAQRDTGFTLTALLDPGLAPGHYSIGKTSEWDGQHKNDASAVGTFFASYSAPKDQGSRNFGGTMVSGPFWSDSGRVSITKFDGETLELNFEALLTENIPETYSPRKVRVVGGLSTSVGAGGDVDGLNLSNENLNVKAYLCGGEESGEFDLVSSLPAANATNAEYLDTLIRVTFTQAVDPDSLMDNAFVEFRGTNGRTGEIPGSWVVNPRNPRMINFIPQATLSPGTVHCVQLDAGAEGIRSMGGNTLTGLSQNGFTQAMAPACSYTDASDDTSETRRFAFSTQVELTGVWVDFYQASLVGNGVKLVPEKRTVARVYPYWQSPSGNVHETAQVTKFSAKVHVVRDRTAFLPEQSATIKRPDLFTADERRRGKNSVNFVGLAPNVRDTQLEASAFAVIKPMSNSDALLRSVYPSAISELNLSDYEIFNLAWIDAQGVCPPRATPEECGWDEPVKPYVSTEQFRDAVSTGVSFGFENMPVSSIYVLDDWEDDVVPCTEGNQEGICIDEEVIMIQLQGPLETRADDVAGRLAALVANHSDPGVGAIHATIVTVAPGLLPDPDYRPIQLYPFAYPLSPVILVQADRLDAAELAYFLVQSVLRKNGCHHYGPTENCDPTPVSDDYPWTVQGHRLTPGFESPHFNKHHAEGNEESDRLLPFLRDGPDDLNLRERFISAYHYKRLFAPIANRSHIWEEDNR